MYLPKPPSSFLRLKAYVVILEAPSRAGYQGHQRENALSLMSMECQADLHRWLPDSTDVREKPFLEAGDMTQWIKKALVTQT